MTSSNDAAGRLALITGGVAIGSTFATAWGLLTGAALPVVLSTGMMGIPATILHRHYRRFYGVGMGDLVVAVGHVVDDLDQSLTDDKFPDLGPVLARRLRPMRRLALPEMASTDWITSEFWLSSTAYIGQPGTHKSVNLKHHTDQVVRLQGLDALWGICDTHYDPDEPKPLDTWLPGIPREQVPFYKKPEEGFAALRAFYAEFVRRRDNNLKAENFAVLVIDEFQDSLPKDQVGQAVDWIGEIVRGGRKFGMRLLLGLHSPKKGENGMDSSIFWSMTTVVMGLTIADQTVAWPADVKGNQKALLADIEATHGADEFARFTVAVVRPASNAELGFKGAMVKRLEDRSQRMVPFVFDSIPWIEQVRAKAETAINDGTAKSFTGLCRALGLEGCMKKDKATGQYKDERVQVLFEEYAQFF